MAIPESDLLQFIADADDRAWTSCVAFIAESNRPNPFNGKRSALQALSSKTTFWLNKLEREGLIKQVSPGLFVATGAGRSKLLQAEVEVAE